MIFALKFLLILIPILVSVAFLTLLERKILGLIGIRKGPYKVSALGILQPITDALKLSNKQLNSISSFSYFFYYLSSIFILTLSVMLWEVLCFNIELISCKNSMLMLMMILAIMSLKSILSGWSTFSKFSLIGSIRTLSMLLTYESVLYLILMFLILSFNSLSLVDVSEKNFFLILLFPILFIIWIISSMAELNRTPFDFSEGESELVSGFNTEFGSKCFTVLFLSEYSNIIFMMMVTSMLFSLKSFLYFMFLMFFIVWIRGVLPRYRYDKMMSFAWKLLIPLMTLVLLILVLILE